MTRRSWIGLAAVLAVVAGLPVLMVGHLRASSGASRLPERGLEVVTVPGLNRPVEIVLDRRAVPHVRAGDADDAWFAQGYLHARERFFQMDLVRRTAEGRMAELFGAEAVASDRRARIWRLDAIARRQAAGLGEDHRSVLEAYTAGVNAALVGYGRWVAPETWLLGVEPEPWTVEDSLAIAVLQQLGSSSAMGEEMERAVELAHLGRERAVDLWGWTPQEAREWIPGAEPPSVLRRSDDAITPAVGGIGSNAWAVTPDRSAAGRPLLANDLHLGPSLPAPWYLVHLSGPGLDVAGASIPGMPGVVVGHTRDVAWGLALTDLDDQDLYVVTVDEGRARELVDGRWQPLRTVTEPIRVRWESAPTVLKVQLSERGPVVRSGLHSVLALAWTGSEGPSPVAAFLNMATARTVADVVAAWEGVVGPSVNIVAADVHGTVLQQVVGQVPRRRRGAGRLPAPGSDSGWAWAGLRPITDRARIEPAGRGWVVAANQDLVAEGDLPASIVLPGEYQPPWRARRVSDRLETRHDWDVPGFVALQRDVQSQRAVAMLRMLRPRLVADGGVSATGLLAWGGAVGADSVGAHVYARLLVHLTDAVGGDEAASAGLSRSPLGPDELLRLLAGGMDESWWDDQDTPAVEGPDDIVARVLSELDRDPAVAPWGRVHQVRFEHPLCRHPIVARVLGGAWSRGPFAIGGDDTTIDAGPWSGRDPFSVTAVPTLRFVADVGSWDETVMVLPPGQSGRPFSSHYSDQLAGWLQAGDGRLPFTREAVDSAGVARLRLEPADPSPSPTSGLLAPDEP